MRVFVSYSRMNVDAANYIAAELRRRGADVFVDYERLKAGENFPERLALEIEGSDAMIFLLSEHSAASDWVRDEVQYARSHRKRIIPVALDTTELPRAFFFLVAVEGVDFTRWNGDRQVEAAIHKLAISLGLPDAWPSPPALLPEGEGRKMALDILPPPFEWIEIPGGEVTLGTYRTGGYITKPTTFEVEAFDIAKYPITKAQYQAFVDAPDGYRETKWGDYSKQAQAWRREHPQPEDTAFSGDDDPRTNVTWFEAAAFCRWLSHRTGDSIMLPSEQQWQRAAQGGDGRAYPWGKDFDPSRCNSSVESQSSGTTPVTKYEKEGDSPFGVVDMSGNVGEWCATDYETGSQDIK